MKFLFMLLMIGCENRPNVTLGQTFQFVKLQKHTAKPVNSPVEPEKSAPEAEKSTPEAEFIMTSEESAANFQDKKTESTNKGNSAAVLEVDLRTPEVTSKTTSATEVRSVDNAVGSNQQEAKKSYPIPSFSWEDWPVQVLKVMHDVQPPLALLGLPNGEDRAVKAGEMLPQFGLIVMSIGQKEVYFVKVSAQGNRTKVQPFRLAAQ